MKDSTAVLFNHDWKFLLGDPLGAEKENYCDRTWKHIDLPHDWVIHQPFDQGEDKEPWSEQSMQGYFVWKSIGWYRKEFTLEEIAEKDIYLYFGCAYRNATIYVNGKKAGTHAYGYTSFELCVTPYVRPGKNLIAIRLDNGAQMPDRWYSGAGLFRDVYLRVAPNPHFDTWGLGVKTFTNKDGSAKIDISARLENTASSGGTSVLRLSLIDPEEKEIETHRIDFEFSSQSETILKHSFHIKAPKLWSDSNPHLYRLTASINNGNSREINIGIRTVEMIAKKGFIINGKSIKLKGVCLHHDCGILGAAFYKEAWRRRLLILKGLGCNAIRTSHNPQAEEFLDLCDELGFYVIDECLDKWRAFSYKELFDENWRRDIHDCIMRDRNHPSVFLWSVGNEVQDPGSAGMVKLGKMLCDYARTLDDRPVTLALMSWWQLGDAPPEKHVEMSRRIAEFVDVLAFNYQEPLYPFYSKGIDMPIIGTECHEYYSGSLQNDGGFCNKNPWRYVLEDDNVMGQFIWTGIDFLGDECGWPTKAWTGASLDICAFYKDEAWLRKALWSSEPVVHLCFYDNTQNNNYARGHWNFPYTASHLNLKHLERRIVTAAVYTNCDEAELRINGKKIGRRKPVDFENGIIEWTFDYTSGELKVIGFRDGKEAAFQEMKTAGLPAVIDLKADRTQIEPYGIAHIEVTITDESGIPNPTGNLLLGFSLEGDGIILGASSPEVNNPLFPPGFDLPRVYTSFGKALAIIRAGASTGELCFSAYGEDLKTGRTHFTVEEK